MKRILIFLVISLSFSLFALSCSDNYTEDDFTENNLGYVDKVIFEVRTDMTIGIKDVAEGRAHLMASGVDGSVYFSLHDRDKSKLSTYAVPSGSWSLLFNPAINEAPYTYKKSGDDTVYFNPLAIKEVRFSFNWLVNRKKIVDEILRGAGEPSYTQATPGQPGTYRYNLIPSKMGMTDIGDENKAIEDINNALIKASVLPENNGKLIKKDGFWHYNNEPIIIKMIIRVDDPSGRLPMGNSVADSIEKAGIKVERLLYDRSRSAQIVYATNPADFQWHIMTEGWGAGATRAWWDVSLRQMYVREGNYMPGGNNDLFWNYGNKEASALSDKNYNGWFIDSDEYWKGNIRLQEIGLEDAVRVYLNTQTQFFVANKELFNNRMLYGVADGVNQWSIRSADIKPNKNGKKILRVLQHSSQGSLFISPWDPVGVGGFSDAYSSIIIGACSDSSSVFESPSTASYEFIWGEIVRDSVEIGVVANSEDGKKPIGTVDVSDEAVLFNPYLSKWQKGKAIKVNGSELSFVDKGDIKSYSKAIFKPKFFVWHNGVKSSMVDLVYSSIFRANIATKTDENDKYYDSALAGRIISPLDGAVGTIINKDSFEVYSQFYWPMDKERQIAFLGVGPKIGNPNRNTVIPFEINEAIMRLIIEGSKSGVKYTLSQDQALTSIDVKNPTCVDDIKDKLSNMLSEVYIPVGLEEFITADEITNRYQSSIEFIEKYGHAYISNGPFFISRIDTRANYIELSAFSDYSYSMDYWVKKLSKEITRIEDIEMPNIVNKNESLNIEVLVSSYKYPETLINEAPLNTKVKAYLQLESGGEMTFDSKFIDGIYKFNIDSSVLKNLKSDNYILVFESFIDDETPSVVTRIFALN